MENMILLFATTLMASIRSNRLRRYQVGNTGCSVSMVNHDKFHVSKTSGGDYMYYAESKNNGADYGVVMIQFSEAGKPASQWKSLLSEFSKSLHPSFGIVHATAPEWNYWHPQSPAAIGFTEYAQDKNGVDWKICSWINGDVMVISYVKNINHAPVKNQEAFLESFRFAKR